MPGKMISQQSSVQDQNGHGEINDDPEDVDERGNERCGRDRRIEPQPLESKGKHGTCNGSPKDDTDERKSDRYGDEEMVRPEGRGSGHRPKLYARESDGTEYQPKKEP